MCILTLRAMSYVNAVEPSCKPCEHVTVDCGLMKEYLFSSCFTCYLRVLVMVSVFVPLHARG